jgi:hypothetical protein
MLEQKLRKETEKWLEKIEVERKKIKLIDDSKKELLNNIDAYISDCRHFLKEGKLIEAFEAVLWAWSWMEILLRLKILKRF